MSESLQPHRLYSPWNSPGQNTGVGSCSLLQGIFPTQGSNPCLPHCRWILYHLSHRDAQCEFPQLETRCPSSALTVLHCQETPVPSPSLNAQCPQLALPPTIQRQHQSLHFSRTAGTPRVNMPQIPQPSHHSSISTGRHMSAKSEEPSYFQKETALPNMCRHLCPGYSPGVFFITL